MDLPRFLFRGLPKVTVVRILRPGGCLTVFGGDHATGTLTTGAGDPLDACAEAFRIYFIRDPWKAEARRRVASGEYFGHIAYRVVWPASRGKTSQARQGHT